MRALLAAEGISVHYITSRVKNKFSTLQKLQRPGKNYTGIGDLTDVLGIRIVTYFPDGVDAVADVVKREFIVDEENSIDKRALLDSDRFGYLSLHFIAKFGEQRASLAEYAKYSDVAFEIQVRSILQHAWAEIEHDLGYKSNSTIPREIRRRFSRLAGLLELADSEFTDIKRFLTERDDEIERAGESAEEVQLDEETMFVLIQRDPGIAALDRKISRALNMIMEPPRRDYASSLLQNAKLMGVDTWQELSDRLKSESKILYDFMMTWILDLYKDVSAPDLEGLDAVPPGLAVYYLYLWDVANGKIPDGGQYDQESLIKARDYAVRLQSLPGEAQEG
ncbi:GTP pyrophosphokinase family protein [Streptomyces anulatus]